MQIRVLQNLGDFLYRELSALRHAARLKTPEARGAGGDMTGYIDRRAEEIIISGLESLNEPPTVISEEAGIVHLHGGWMTELADPIDESRNAVYGITIYGTSLAVAAEATVGDPYVAYILKLVIDTVFWAEKGLSSYFLKRSIQCRKGDEFSFVFYDASTPSPDLLPIMPLLSVANKLRWMGNRHWSLPMLPAVLSAPLHREVAI